MNTLALGDIESWNLKNLACRPRCAVSLEIHATYEAMPLRPLVHNSFKKGKSQAGRDREHASSYRHDQVYFTCRSAQRGLLRVPCLCGAFGRPAIARSLQRANPGSPQKRPQFSADSQKPTWLSHREMCHGLARRSQSKAASPETSASHRRHQNNSLDWATEGLVELPGPSAPVCIRSATGARRNRRQDTLSCIGQPGACVRG